MAGNNCLISSVMQALLGKDLHGPEHDEQCAQIRLAGMGSLWAARDFIEANTATLEFVTDRVLGAKSVVLCHLYSSHDGTTVSHVRCNDASVLEDSLRVIHIFNPTGVHFDLLRQQRA